MHNNKKYALDAKSKKLFNNKFMKIKQLISVVIILLIVHETKIDKKNNGISTDVISRTNLYE